MRWWCHDAIAKQMRDHPKGEQCKQNPCWHRPWNTSWFMMESLQWAYHSLPYGRVIFHPLKQPTELGCSLILCEAHLAATMIPHQLSLNKADYSGQLFPWILGIGGWMGPPLRLGGIPPFHPSLRTSERIRYPYEFYLMDTYGYLKIYEYIQLYIPY